MEKEGEGINRAGAMGKRGKCRERTWEGRKMLRKREEQRGEKDKEEEIGRERKWDTVKDGENRERGGGKEGDSQKGLQGQEMEDTEPLNPHGTVWRRRDGSEGHEDDLGEGSCPSPGPRLCHDGQVNSRGGERGGGGELAAVSNPTGRQRCRQIEEKRELD